MTEPTNGNAGVRVPVMTQAEVQALARKVGVHDPVTFDAMTRLVNAALASHGVPLPPATFRQGNWSHPAGDGSHIVGWVIPAADVERMGADAYVLPGEVADAMTRLAAAHGVAGPGHQTFPPSGTAGAQEKTK